MAMSVITRGYNMLEPWFQVAPTASTASTATPTPLDETLERPHGISESHTR